VYVVLGVVGADAFHMKVRRLHVDIRHDDNADTLTLFDVRESVAFLVEQECAGFKRYANHHLAGLFLHGLFFDQTQDRQRQRLRAAHDALTGAAWADQQVRFAQGGAKSLAGHFQQAKSGNSSDLDPGPIVLQRFAQTIFHVTLVLGRRHIDEVDDNKATQITQS
jgi:hypothetical protein